MRSQNIKHKTSSSGKVIGASCLSLLLLTFLAINPLVGVPAFAEEAEDMDNVEMLAVQEEIPSSVNIAFIPASGSASLSPTTPTGQSAQINVLAKVDVQNSGGYTVYLKSNSQNLVGQKNSDNIIPGATTAKTYNAMDVNTWGYYASEGSSVPEGATYKAISVSGNGDKVAENSNSKIKTDTKNIMLSFAAKINDEKPADTYQNTVTMSVVSSPLQTTLTDIANMQDMTTSICEASSMYETKQLKDVRDGKYYWVTKLADNKCWMTQNLDLDLGDEWPDASLSDYEVAGTTYKPVPTFDEVTSENIDTSSTATRSWSLGDVRLVDPLEVRQCASKLNDATGCPEWLATYTTPITANGEEDAHYILGNFYQWNTATAGTGGIMTTGQASGSICPRGWRLPTSSPTGELQGLVNAGGIGNDATKISSAPYYFVKGGAVWQNAEQLFAGAGYTGRYWSSTPADASDAVYAYLLYFSGSNLVAPFDSGVQSSVPSKRLGLSIRCMAR